MLNLPPTFAVANYYVPAFIYAIVWFTAFLHGIPTWLLLGFVNAESSSSYNAHNVTPHEASYGLLQLNKKGGQGAGYTIVALYDPLINLIIGTPPIAAAARQATARDLRGLAWIEAVAASSGHPRSDGVVDDGVRRIAAIVLAHIVGPDGHFIPYPLPLLPLSAAPSLDIPRSTTGR